MLSEKARYHEKIEEAAYELYGLGGLRCIEDVDDIIENAEHKEAQCKYDDVEAIYDAVLDSIKAMKRLQEVSPINY